jgi:acetyl esterase/lipase
MNMLNTETVFPGIKRQFLNLAYADQSEMQKLDLYLPEHYSDKLPLLVFIHGGGFAVGDKRDIRAIPFQKGLDRGFALASINYRLSGEAVFPAAVHDCKCAVRWLRANAETYKLDPDRIGVIGASAGGNLAALLATGSQAGFLEDKTMGNGNISSNVQACIDWFGPTDFLLLDEHLSSLGFAPCYVDDADSPVSRYMNGKVSELTEDFVQKANPASYINNDLPPIFIQHGSADSNVPVQQSQLLVEAIEKKLGADRVRFEILKGAGHGGTPFTSDENMEKFFHFLTVHLHN